MMKIMQRGYIAGVTVLVSMVLAIVMAGGSVAAPGDTTRVSVDSFGNQAEEGPQGSYEASISSDGRHVAFSSYASDLVEGDTNAKSDIFVHDRPTATTERDDRARKRKQLRNPGQRI